MRIAVLSLTRDRVEYTEHCFNSLREHAGCDYDHFVLDQGSKDETPAFLRGFPCTKMLLNGNVGIHRGHNLLLDAAGGGYDAYVTFDNDCEVMMPGTLQTASLVACEARWVLSPTVLGLIHPPQPTDAGTHAGERLGLFPAIGGIFRTMPGPFIHGGFRFNENQPYWGGDEAWVGQQALLRGYKVGYLLDWTVNHYETTQVQDARYPDYHSRKLVEMAA